MHHFCQHFQKLSKQLNEVIEKKINKYNTNEKLNKLINEKSKKV